MVLNGYFNENETIIQGIVSELNIIASCVENTEQGSVRAFSLSKSVSLDPEDTQLETLVFNCNGKKINVCVIGKTLVVEFSAEAKEMIASYFAFELDSFHGQHCHFDRYGNEDYFDDRSLDMVIQVIG